MESLRPVKVNMTIEAPKWAFVGGFPEDMPFTEPADVPEGAKCVETYVVDGYTGKECAIFQKGEQTYKIELSNK